MIKVFVIVAVPVATMSLPVRDPKFNVATFIIVEVIVSNTPVIAFKVLVNILVDVAFTKLEEVAIRLLIVTLFKLLLSDVRFVIVALLEFRLVINALVVVEF